MRVTIAESVRYLVTEESQMIDKNIFTASKQEPPAYTVNSRTGGLFMENISAGTYNIYKDISARTKGDIYIGEPDIIGLNQKLKGNLMMPNKKQLGPRRTYMS